MPTCPKGLPTNKDHALPLKRQDLTIIPDAPVFGRQGGRVVQISRGSIVSPTVDRRDLGGSISGSLIPTDVRNVILDLLQTQRQFTRFKRSVPVPQQQIMPAVIPRVRSRPASESPGPGLLPAQIFQNQGGAQVPTFFESLGDVAVDFARQEFLTTGGPSPPGTVVEFPTTFAGVPAGPLAGVVQQPFVKKRRRRKRLLTASDKCDIAAMKAMLSGPEFKIWLACPSMFKG